MLYGLDKEKPFSVQLFGSDTESFKIAPKIIGENKLAELIDINMGGSVKKVAINKKSGSALLKNPSKVYSIT